MELSLDTKNCGNPLKQWVPIFCGCKNFVATLFKNLKLDDMTGINCSFE